MAWKFQFFFATIFGEYEATVSTRAHIQVKWTLLKYDDSDSWNSQSFTLIARNFDEAITIWKHNRVFHGLVNIPLSCNVPRIIVFMSGDMQVNMISHNNKKLLMTNFDQQKHLNHYLVLYFLLIFSSTFFSGILSFLLLIIQLFPLDQ